MAILFTLFKSPHRLLEAGTIGLILLDERLGEFVDRGLDGGGDREAAAFLDALRIFGLGYSWGGFESLALQPDLSDRVAAKAPAEGPVIRLQIGLEDVSDLKEDIERGFAAVEALHA